LQHPIFKKCIEQNEMAEAQRCFCHHDIEHICAVARIAMLMNLEENLGLAKDMVYAAALLHDCGRFEQYIRGIPHDEAGAAIASSVLPECGYEENEIASIVAAITSHRGASEKKRESVLADVIYRADKMSRNCAFCKVYEECNWTKEKKEQAFCW
jgi:putative nucleotidyltransferase with HDIG domain